MQDWHLSTPGRGPCFGTFEAHIEYVDKTSQVLSLHGPDSRSGYLKCSNKCERGPQNGDDFGLFKEHAEDDKYIVKNVLLPRSLVQI